MDKEIRHSIRRWDQDDLKKHLIKDGINCSLCPMFQWKFQPLSASHMNRVWERLIRSVRKTMKAILGNPAALLGLETLRSVYAEVVTILNCRSLTPSSDDPSDPEHSLRITFCCNRKISLCPQVCLFAKIFTEENNGGDPNSLLTASGKGS